jgi:outer membrane protein assembly factor BamB
MIGDQLLVPTTTETGPIVLGLAALNASDGTLHWHREICGISDSRPTRTHLYGHNLLSVSNGSIIWSTMYGCVFKIDPRNGRISWAVSYPSVEENGAHSTRSTLAMAPPLVRGGMVYVAGASEHRVLAIDETHGVVRWSTSLPTRVTQLVGERDGILVAGGESLWGIESSSGEHRWKCGFDSPDGACIGTAVIAGDTAWWTTQGDLLGADVRTGVLVARRAIREAWGIRGGSLFLSSRRLLLLEPGRISAIAIQ